VFNHFMAKGHTHYQLVHGLPTPIISWFMGCVWKNDNGIPNCLSYCVICLLYVVCWSQWPGSVRSRSMALAYCDCGFEFHRGHGCFSVVCCQVEISAMSWSLVQWSPTDCGMSCVITKNLVDEEAIVHAGMHTEKKNMVYKCGCRPHSTTWQAAGWRPTKSSCNYMYHLFNIQNLCIFPHPLCLGVSVLLTGNGDYFTMLHLVTGLYKEDKSVLFEVRIGTWHVKFVLLLVMFVLILWSMMLNYLIYKTSALLSQRIVHLLNEDQSQNPV
jgi:hypothetical protein